MGPSAVVSAAAAAAAAGGAAALLPDRREVQAAERRLRHAESQLAKFPRYRANDYAVEESDLRRSLVLNTTDRQFRGEAAFAWALSLVIGLLNGLAGFLFNQGIYMLNKVKFDTTLRFIRPGAGFGTPFAVYLAFTLLYAAVAGALGSYVSPQAAGSGIPEIRCYLNGIHSFGVLFSIAAGLVVGKEGPFTHVGAIIGGGVAGLGSTTLTRATNGRWRAALRTRFGRYFRSSISHRDYVAAGAAAGVSSAFGSPIGGILFSVEQGASFFNYNMLSHAFIAAGVAIFVSLLLSASLWHRSDLYRVAFTLPQQFVLMNEVAEKGRFWYYCWEMPIFALMGVGGGILGAGMVVLNNRVTSFRRRFVPATRPARRVAEVMALAGATATAWLLAAYLSPCEPVSGEQPQTDFRDPRNPVILYAGLFPQLWCPDGQYSRFGVLFFAPQTAAISLLFQYQVSAGYSLLFSPAALATLACLGWFFMSITFGIGAVTGLFVPSLLVGGAAGRLAGRAVRAAAAAVLGPGSAVEVCLGTYAVVGAAAVLGGVSRMLLCNIVITMETAGASAVTVPLIGATWVAKMVADALVPRGIFDVAIERAGYPYLEAEPSQLTDVKLQHALSAGDVMTSKLQTLPCVVRIRHLVEVLRRYPTGAMTYMSAFAASAAALSLGARSARWAPQDAAAAAEAAPPAGALDLGAQQRGRDAASASAEAGAGVSGLRPLGGSGTSAATERSGGETVAYADRRAPGAVGEAAEGDATGGSTAATVGQARLHWPSNQQHEPSLSDRNDGGDVDGLLIQNSLISGAPPTPSDDATRAVAGSSAPPARAAALEAASTALGGGLGGPGLAGTSTQPEPDEAQGADVDADVGENGGGYSGGVIVGVISRSILLKLLEMRQDLSLDRTSNLSSGGSAAAAAVSSKRAEGASAATTAPRRPWWRSLFAWLARAPTHAPSHSHNSDGGDGGAAGAAGKDSEPWAVLGARRAAMSGTRAARLLDAVDNYPAKAPADGLGEEAVFARLGPADLDSFLDLRNFMQRVPYVVPATASLARTYRLFRGLGLHHILVTAPSIPVIGLITRSDIAGPKAYCVAYELAQREQQGLQALLHEQQQQRQQQLREPQRAGPEDGGTDDGYAGVVSGGAPFVAAAGAATGGTGPAWPQPDGVRPGQEQLPAVAVWARAAGTLLRVLGMGRAPSR
ncbi:hypothetical protein GPECTOR_22g910 [Gonium pectorale]|uniref:Chloride channel protein n=1 Tax=Gonium pectorale TaxID=33097 RepID=A0A150GHL2_GONPE|nr:hypothetical protein GPECTOR_22g910 [Gonium pectorale]|eukprot:KXZ49316.1 hypothetical protein GPECTOR_22g910 [Gonium pectorale]